MMHFGLRRYLRPSHAVLEKHPPNERIEPRIDPMLESMRLNLMRQRAHFIIEPPVFVSMIDVFQNLAMMLWRKNHDAGLDDVGLAWRQFPRSVPRTGVKPCLPIARIEFSVCRGIGDNFPENCSSRFACGKTVLVSDADRFDRNPFYDRGGRGIAKNV